MNYIFPTSIQSSEHVSFIFIPTVYGIPSLEEFGNVNLPQYASIPSQERVGSPEIGIWWLKWRAFDSRNMYVPVIKAFSEKDERREYAENLIKRENTKPDWKFTTFCFGKPDLPKNKIWDKLVVYMVDRLF